RPLRSRGQEVHGEQESVTAASGSWSAPHEIGKHFWLTVTWYDSRDDMEVVAMLKPFPARLGPLSWLVDLVGILGAVLNDPPGAVESCGGRTDPGGYPAAAC